jgi:hypothetical protein
MLVLESPFPRRDSDDALGAIEDPTLAEPGMFSRARSSVKAKEPSPVGVLLKTVEAGSIGATAPADWT